MDLGRVAHHDFRRRIVVVPEIGQLHHALGVFDVRDILNPAVRQVQFGEDVAMLRQPRSGSTRLLVAAAPYLSSCKQVQNANRIRSARGSRSFSSV